MQAACRPAVRVPRSARALTCAVGAALGLALALPARPQTMALSDPAATVQSTELAAAYTRWRTSIDAFAEQDREHPPTAGAVLFVGSSTIRFWSHLAQDFRQVPVVMNRGFGGSTMNDCSLLVRDLVTRYKPSQVLVYAGDNDLAEGRTPRQVLASFQYFVKVLREELPDVRLAYISIKPSPSRAALLPRIRETNALLADYVATLPNAKYIDIFTAMLGEDGQPRRDLFLGDALHMNAAGYAIWQGVITSYLGGGPVPLPGSVNAAASPAAVPVTAADATAVPASSSAR
ncbi:SGNH/GDSL hydrolase family protein [Xylophilus sp.]|uniref:SGNH/GDSL hydrolase family protein n=1 Tax=Xylophilus sp. TaxID=2653893 RepID=UPI0013B858F8|nr:SGNH/GDSL hydrolase family protein [Xylophilus sp.]KAF1043775.1 MAG: hypothetical protein GAK38_03820 [Xylophilus sp.]